MRLSLLTSPGPYVTLVLTSPGPYVTLVLTSPGPHVTLVLTSPGPRVHPRAHQPCPPMSSLAQGKGGDWLDGSEQGEADCSADALNPALDLREWSRLPKDRRMVTLITY